MVTCIPCASPHHRPAHIQPNTKPLSVYETAHTLPRISLKIKKSAQAWPIFSQNVAQGQLSFSAFQICKLGKAHDQLTVAHAQSPCGLKAAIPQLIFSYFPNYANQAENISSLGAHFQSFRSPLSAPLGLNLSPFAAYKPTLFLPRFSPASAHLHTLTHKITYS